MKLDRLLGILTTLLQRDRVTAPYLAEKFEVSRRTISRDIDALCQAGIPVMTMPGGGGGIAIAEGFKLDKSVLTEGELSNLIAALKGIGTVAERTQMERMLEKLHMGRDTVISLRENMVIDLASHYRGSLTKKIEQIKHAMQERRLIEFDYYYEKGESHRRVEPYFIAFQWTAWYVFCYCLDRQDFRMFKLTRLWNLSVCEEGFALRDIPPERRDFSTYFTDHLRMVAVFDASVKYQLMEMYGPDCYTVEPDGKLRLEMGYTNRDYTRGWLLSFGDKVKVLESVDLAEEIRRIAEKIVESYR